MLKLRKDDEKEVLRKWTSSEQGRLALKILREEFYDIPSFDENPLRMAFIGGQRDLVEYLLDMQED